MFVSTRTLVATVDQLTEIGEVVSIPVVGDSDSLQVEGVSGCTYIGRDSLSATSWRLRFSLPRPVALGETYDTVVRFTWPGRDWIQPVAAIVPMRPVDRFGVTASFGSPRTCAVRVGAQRHAAHGHRGPVTRPDDHHRRAYDVEFDDLLLGHAYGIAWTWA